MPVLRVVPDLTSVQPDEPFGEEFNRARARGFVHVTQELLVGGIPEGMASKKPSVALIARLPDGTFAFIETSLELYLASAQAMAAHYQERGRLADA